MNIVQYTVVLLMAFSLVFAEQAEAKQHSSQKTRSRVLKEISKKTTPKANSTIKIVHS